MDGHLICQGNVITLIVASSTMSILTISKDDSLSLGNKTEVDGQVACLQTIKGTYIPGIALTTRQHHIFADLAIEGSGLVPDGRYVRNKVRTLQLLQVVGRIIAEHGEWGVEDDILCQLMTACALRHGFIMNGRITTWGSITHGALGIVSSHQTDERDGDIIGDLIDSRRCPFHVLQSEDTFEVDDIRVGTCQTSRLEGAMEVC